MICSASSSQTVSSKYPTPQSSFIGYSLIALLINSCRLGFILILHTQYDYRQDVCQYWLFLDRNYNKNISFLISTCLDISCMSQIFTMIFHELRIIILYSTCYTFYCHLVISFFHSLIQLIEQKLVKGDFDSSNLLKQIIQVFISHSPFLLLYILHSLNVQ